MGVLKHTSNFQNCIKSTNKIPEYARDYKKEYLFIRGINKEFKYILDNLDELNSGLFESDRVNRIMKIIKRYLRGQERGKLRDISNLILPKYDFIYMEEFYINIYYEFEDNTIYIEFNDLLEKLYNQIKKIENIFSDYYGEGFYI